VYGSSRYFFTDPHTVVELPFSNVQIFRLAYIIFLVFFARHLESPVTASRRAATAVCVRFVTFFFFWLLCVFFPPPLL